MSEQVERMAEAMYRFNWPVAGPWRQADTALAKLYCDQARAVIAALGEDAAQDTLADGCAAEHSPATNAECEHAEAQGHSRPPAGAGAAGT